MKQDIFKKVIYAGFGMAILGKRKAEQFVSELGETMDLSEKEFANFSKRFESETEKMKGEWEAKIKNTVKSYLNKMDVPTREEVDALKKRIEELEKGSPETPDEDEPLPPVAG